MPLRAVMMENSHSKLNIFKIFMRIILFISMYFLFIPANTFAQPPGGGDPSDLPITVSELNNSDLDFGQILSNSGLHIVDINNSKVLGITAVRFLDVLVEIVAGNELLLDNNPSCSGDPSCSIPFTLDAAYANEGQNDPAQSKPFTINGNTAVASFRIREGGGNNIPPPAFRNPERFEETAYIYIFGSINAGLVDGGRYVNNITVTVIHD